jgi:signal transduction histidine kinase
MLPDMDGIQLLKRIRALDNECAVVMLTGVGSIKSAMIALREGADGYVEKQHLVLGNEESELLYALGQAMAHRAGIIARRQLEEVKAHFYSMVTHDLRTPAGNIAASLKLVLAGKGGELTARQRELLDVAFNSANKLLTQINEYLDFSKIDAGYMRLERRLADLRLILEASLGQAAPQAAERDLIVQLHPSAQRAQGLVDSDKLGQVFDNLISNAIKYTPQHGRIDLFLSVENDVATVRITDSGHGIAAGEIATLFTKYNRIPGASTRGVTGTGLGLVIVKEIVEAHGGTVTAESAGTNTGTTFIVTIPLATG